MTRRGRIFVLLVVLPLASSHTQPGSSLNTDSLFFEGLRFYRQGEVSPAASRFRLLLDFSPWYHDARVLYGRILSFDGRYAEAIVQFDSVLFFQPGHREARFAKAQVFAWTGRYRSAADILHALTQEDPRSALFWLQLGNVYFWGGSPARALEFYERAYLRDPLSEEVLRALARVHRRLRSYELSLQWYRTLLARVPGDFEALNEILRLTYRSTHEIQILGLYESFVRGAMTGHALVQLEYYLTPHEDWKPFVHFSRVDKFANEEHRFGGGSYVTFGYATSVLVQVLVSPGATIAPQIDALAEISLPAGGGIELGGGYRYLRFDSLHVHVPSPFLSFYVSDQTWLSVRGYFGFGSNGTSSSAGMLSLMYRTTPFTTVRIGGFAGNEAFRATTLEEISSLRSVGGFIGVKSRISSVVAVDAQYQFTSRNRPSNSHLLQLTLSFLF